MNHRQRAQGLLGKMNAREKAAQLYSVWLKIGDDGSLAFRDVRDGFIQDVHDDPRAVLRDGIGQVTRPLGARPADARGVVRGLNALQKFLVEGTRLGIPALVHEECLPGLMAKGATLFPAAINLGSLWDEEAVFEAAAVIGRELYSVGSRQGLAPVLDVCRDARWGRVEETLQLYVRDVQARFVRPVKELKSFRRVSLAPGQKKTAHFSLPVDLLCYSPDGMNRVVEPGAFEIMIGRSCEEIVFRSTVTVTGAKRTLGRGWRMRTEVRVD